MRLHMIISFFLFYKAFRETYNRNVQEADILRQLHSQYIVKYENAFEQDGKLYIIMEYAPNGSLAQLIEV